MPLRNLFNLQEILHRDNQFTQALAVMETKTGLARHLIVEIFAAFVCLYILLGSAGELVVNVLCFAYPAHMSSKAIELETRLQTPYTQETCSWPKWLMYWPIYGSLLLMEHTFPIITNALPLYWFCKFCFLVWCFAEVPWNGSGIIFSNIVKPFMQKHQEEIDAVIDIGKQEVVGFAKDVANNTILSRSASARKVNRKGDTH